MTRRNICNHLRLTTRCKFCLGGFGTDWSVLSKGLSVVKGRLCLSGGERLWAPPVQTSLAACPGEWTVSGEVRSLDGRGGARVASTRGRGGGEEGKGREGMPCVSFREQEAFDVGRRSGERQPGMSHRSRFTPGLPRPAPAGWMGLAS